MHQPRGTSRSTPLPYTEPGLALPVTHDAVVVVPGIMGSELYDTRAKKVIWGLADGSWLARAWLAPQGLDGLHVTPEELDGDHTRVQARRLLRFPAWSPFLRGFEPYHKLVRTIEDTVAHRDAIMTFPYDWRLPIAVNARRLAEEAREHLQRWRANPLHDEARRQAVDERPARLVFVAHSMGGLVACAALALGHDSDLAADTRGVMTLGTPFRGSVVAANILNAVQGGPLPLPHRRLAAAAATMPAVHELLPQFLCVEDGLDVRRLSPADVGALGGDKDLFGAAEDFFTRFHAALDLPQLWPVVGIRQDTLQSMRLVNGVVHASEYSFRTDTDGTVKRLPTGAPLRVPLWGDGTVHRGSVPAVRQRPMPVFAQHGAMASGKDARRAVADFLLQEEHLGPDQAEDGIGLSVPDFVTPNARWDCVITGTDDPAEVQCTVTSLDGDWKTVARHEAIDDGRLGTEIVLPGVGLYRVAVQADYGPAVTQIVFSGPPDGEITV